jgi:hypothetical protein
VPLTKAFHEHLETIMQCDARNKEVQNRFDLALRAGRPGPMVSFSGNEAKPLFKNTGKGFVEIGTTLGAARTEDGRGFVLVDLDGDGALDMVMHNFYRNPLVALLNRAAGDNRWLRVRLRGTKSNRFGIGARVTVNGKIQELACGSGYQSGNAPELHFGLGRAEKADVAVRWPWGKVEEYKGLEANRVYTLTEGDRTALKSETLTPVAIEPDPPEPPAPEPNVKGILAGLRTLGGEPSPVEGPALVILASVGCHVCIEEFKRQPEIERAAFESGLRLVWVATDPDPKAVEEAFVLNKAEFRPHFPAAPIRGVVTPTVYLAGPDRLEKFTGRFAVTAALESARAR